MFERFGEMSSCREINELAENLLNEGDIQNLKVMAQENGIPEDYVEMRDPGYYAGTHVWKGSRCCKRRNPHLCGLSAYADTEGV